MNVSQEINDLVNEYCILRDKQLAIYDKYAKKHGLTLNELFVLDILWFAKSGCIQKEISERLSVNKQTVNATISKFDRLGYIYFETVDEDKRNKRVLLSETGKAYSLRVIQPAADAENIAMADISIKDINELVRLTTLLTENMNKRFDAVMEL